MRQASGCALYMCISHVSLDAAAGGGVWHEGGRFSYGAAADPPRPREGGRASVPHPPRPAHQQPPLLQCIHLPARDCTREDGESPNTARTLLVVVVVGLGIRLCSASQSVFSLVNERDLVTCIL